MRLRNRLLFIAFFVASLTWLAQGKDSENIIVNTNEDATGEDCDRHFDVHADFPIFRGHEDRTIPRTDVSKLRVHGIRNGGIQIVGWDRNDIFVRLCKAVAASDENAAKPLLEALKLELYDGSVTVSGLERRRSWAHLLVRVPKQIAMQLETRNGPVHVRNVSAEALDVSTQNGPVAVKDCTGKITVDVQNGPVTLARSTGSIRLRATNGPVSVELSDSSWKGEGLEASTRNGPLDLKIPGGYSSGVEVRSDGHSPFSCRLDACDAATKDFDERSRVVRFGKPGQPLLVRLSTVNGPVTIRKAMGKL
jgi:DUF4097 and DUF4098 domain-containing protein YvlB